MQANLSPLREYRDLPFLLGLGGLRLELLKFAKLGSRSNVLSCDHFCDQTRREGKGQCFYALFISAFIRRSEISDIVAAAFSISRHSSSTLCLPLVITPKAPALFMAT